MPFRLVYHPEVRSDDVPLIDAKNRNRLSRAILERLGSAPQSYGVPLRKTLKGYWKLRVGDYRIVFKITGSEVWIFAVMHRKDVYEKVGGRLDWSGTSRVH